VGAKKIEEKLFFPFLFFPGRRNWRFSPNYWLGLGAKNSGGAIWGRVRN
jgi:hypothetical protein